MSESFLRQTLDQNKRLFALMYRFNCQPALDIHPDHVTPIFSSALWERLQSSQRAERKLSRWIVEKWQLDRQGVWDFADIRWRLALLDRFTLARLEQFLGAAACRQQIASILDRNQQQKLKADIGDDVYLFALKRAPFLVKDLPVPGNDASNRLSATLTAAGRECLANCLNDLPRDLLDRVRLKFPPSLDLEAVAEVTMERRLSIWKNVKRVLVTEIAPGLAPCFN